MPIIVLGKIKERIKNKMKERISQIIKIKNLLFKKKKLWKARISSRGAEMQGPFHI